MRLREEKICEAYMKASLLCAKRLEELDMDPDLTKHEGIFTFDVDERWKLAVHAHYGQTIDNLPAYALLVKFNGWPAGLIRASGGPIAAGELANEDTFIAALDAALGDYADHILRQFREEAQNGC